MCCIKPIQHKPQAIVPFALVVIGLFFVMYKVSVVSLFWNDLSTVQQWMGHFLGVNLQGMASWQSTAARVVDMLLWGLLFQDWWFGAKAARAWYLNDGLNEEVIEHINRCAVLINTAWAFTMLVRPFRNLLVQWHLPVVQWVLKWQYAMSDAITLMVCLCLVLMAMICKKWQRTDQENRAFI
ncbi:hypothetical protein B9Z52_01825 [Limnohabitans sp. Jir72]|nr:hypothetical protein B9Z52_01825 [Limnohabitans sp. Jir72]